MRKLDTFVYLALRIPEKVIQIFQRPLSNPSNSSKTPHVRLAMPSTRNCQTATYIAQLCFFITRHYIEKRWRESRLMRLKRRAQRNELTFLLFVILVATRPPRNSPRFWVDTRSSHWSCNVLDGVLLQDDEFEKTFRMTLASFLHLHDIIGISLSTKSLISRAIYPKSRHSVPQGRSASKMPYGLPFVCHARDRL